MENSELSDIILRAVSSIIREGRLPSDISADVANHTDFSRITDDLNDVLQCTLAIARGDPDRRLRSKGIIAGALKSLQANLRHLTWQTQQIAKGDLTQRIDFMGEFSQAFNSMVTALAQSRADLSKAKEAAEAAAAAKSEFLSNMSHELRTPLNAILGFAQLMMRDQNLIPEQRENLDIIIRSGGHLLMLINNVLDLSKIEAGRMTLNEHNSDLHCMLDDLENMFRLKADEKHLQLIAERGPNVPHYIFTDEVRLRQILINLLGNAFKFTREGGVALRVNADDHLLFEVEDTGPGMDSNELSRLFGAFVQTGAGIASREGTGLGLAISRKFVEMMGGQMSVNSEKDKGSLFSFNIRIKAVENIESKTEQAVRRITGLEPGQPQYRILVTDDKWDNRRLLVRLLNSVGLECREAENGQQAIEVWETWEPHLIWMDMRMPVMDGYEATGHIKASAKGQATAVIALTASTFENERSLVLSAGCDDFLRKPFREAEIFDMMKKHLGIRYIYEEDKASTDAVQTNKHKNKVISDEALAALPAELLKELENATIRADMDRISVVIDQIRLYNRDSADVLTNLAERFGYAEILIMTQKGLK